MSEILNPPAPAPAPAPVPAPTARWYEGKADAETVGYLQNRGWHEKDPVTVALEASKAHREAEKFIGVPANELIRLPKTPADAGWDQVWQRLGAPVDKTGYDFSTVKKADGTDIDQGFKDFLAESSASLRLPKETAAALGQAVVKHQETVAAAAQAERTAALETERQTLAKNWGANMEANKFVAKQAALALGVDPETVQALENQVGYAKVMEMFRNIGAKIGEDKFVSSGGNPNNGIMTVEQAVAQKKTLMNDTAWAKRYMDGDAAAKREMTALNTIIVSAQQRAA
jgi:hypothetical protein